MSRKKGHWFLIPIGCTVTLCDLKTKRRRQMMDMGGKCYKSNTRKQDEINWETVVQAEIVQFGRSAALE